jgi:hypothetical protein
MNMIKSLPMLIELHSMLGSFTLVQISYATKYAVRSDTPICKLKKADKLA